MHIMHSLTIAIIVLDAWKSIYIKIQECGVQSLKEQPIFIEKKRFESLNVLPI